MSKGEESARVRCPDCDGHGVISLYSATDFEGPEECRSCNGAGSVLDDPIQPADALLAALEKRGG